MSDKDITYKDVEEAIKQIDIADACPKCGTGKGCFVHGYGGLHCKCKAKELSKTRQAKEGLADFRKTFFEVVK